MQTTVVNVKVAPFDVYIGRKVGDFEESIWANEFKIGRDGTRAEVLEKYEHKIRNSPKLLARLGELRYKTLGCWCKPNACHGDILVKLLNEQSPEETAQSEQQMSLF